MIAALSWLNATKNVWLIAIVIGFGGVTYAAYKNHQAKQIAAAVEATKAKISADALASVEKTAEAEREAIDLTPLPPDKSAIMDLCKRSASCRERSTLK
jgi:uncharacterized membrane protein YebE (DUF533 family)